MEWTIVGLNIAYAVIGVVLMYASFRVIDRLSPRIDFEEELRRGNVAVAVFVVVPGLTTLAWIVKVAVASSNRVPTVQTPVSGS